MGYDVRPYPEPPPGYQPAMRFEYPKMGLQIAAFVVLIGITPLLLFLVIVLQRQSLGGLFSDTDRLVQLVLVVATVLITMVIHELVHGLAYRLLGYRVTFGVSVHLFAAYAAAFGQWQTRDHNIVAALAPLVVLTLLCIPMLALPNTVIVWLALIVLMMNTSGAVGDLYLVWRLLHLPRKTLLYDVDVKTMLIY
ncbi:MAG: DUF3267 domain-containing protein, partial [Anaerolineae bacterium]|nr:DUF3267 domain-containing protein [Anaerolineae bacterium]